MQVSQKPAIAENWIKAKAGKIILIGVMLQYLQVTGKSIPNPPQKNITNGIRLIASIGLTISLLFGGGGTIHEMITKYPDIDYLPLVLNSLHYKATIVVWPLVAALGLRRTLCGAVGHAADCLIKEIESCNWVPTKDLRRRYKLWLHLRELCEAAGYVMPVTYMTICVTMYLLCLPSVYLFVCGSVQGRFWAALPACLTAAFLSITLEISHRAVSKVGSNFKSKLTRLIISGKAGDGERQLEEFLREVAGNPPLMTQAGYFELTRRANISLHSSVITYFIIMLQFRGNSSEAATIHSETEAHRPT